MRSLSAWVCCLALLGCEASVEVNPPINVTLNRQEAFVIDRDGYVEVKTSELTSNIKVVHTIPPMTITVSIDAETSERYVAWTEHNCSEVTSVIKYFAVYDDKNNLIREDKNVSIVVDADPGSIGDAELSLACPIKGKPRV